MTRVVTHQLIRYLLSPTALTHCLPFLAFPIEDGEFELCSDLSLVPGDKEEVQRKIVSGVIVQSLRVNSQAPSGGIGEGQEGEGQRREREGR